MCIYTRAGTRLSFRLVSYASPRCSPCDIHSVPPLLHHLTEGEGGRRRGEWRTLDFSDDPIVSPSVSRDISAHAHHNSVTGRIYLTAVVSVAAARAALGIFFLGGDGEEVGGGGVCTERNVRSRASRGSRAFVSRVIAPRRGKREIDNNSPRERRYGEFFSPENFLRSSVAVQRQVK